METDDESLLRYRVDQFVGELAASLGAVVPADEVRFRVEGRRENRGPILTIRQEDGAGLPLKVEGKTLLRLDLRLQCAWNAAAEAAHRFVAVASSSYRVFVPQAPGAPLFTFDYSRDVGSGVPEAHINVHAHRDEIVFAMLAAGRSGRGKRRASTIERSGRVPRLADLHLPVGGHRFRPALEDVLEMLVTEFGIDPATKDWRATLQRGRAAYRVTQLRTAASDDLEAVADLLEERGYGITRPDRRPARRIDRLTAY